MLRCAVAKMRDEASSTAILGTLVRAFDVEPRSGGVDAAGIEGCLSGVDGWGRGRGEYAKRLSG